MHQLLPPAQAAADVDPLTSYLAAERPAPPDRPWVLMSMVASVDGATAVEGRSGALGGEVDREVFRAVRAVADVILVGAGTLRAERYGPVRLADEARSARVAAGRHPHPARLAVVTRSAELDPAGPAFAAEPAPVVFTTTTATGRLDELGRACEVRRCGEPDVDLRAALGTLRADGASVVVCEGGPRLNAAMVDAGLVDEVCLTMAPALVAGPSSRIVAGGRESALALELVSLLGAEGVLCGRWLVRR